MGRTRFLRANPKDTDKPSLMNMMTRSSREAATASRREKGEKRREARLPAPGYRRKEKPSTAWRRPSELPAESVLALPISVGNDLTIAALTYTLDVG